MSRTRLLCTGVLGTAPGPPRLVGAGASGRELPWRTRAAGAASGPGREGVDPLTRVPREKPVKPHACERHPEGPHFGDRDSCHPIRPRWGGEGRGPDPHPTPSHHKRARFPCARRSRPLRRTPHQPRWGTDGTRKVRGARPAGATADGHPTAGRCPSCFLPADQSPAGGQALEALGGVGGQMLGRTRSRQRATPRHPWPRLPRTPTLSAAHKPPLPCTPDMAK